MNRIRLELPFLDRILSSVNSIVRGKEDFDRAKAILPFFYYFLFFNAFITLEGLNVVIGRGSEHFAPRWPLFFAEGLPYDLLVTALFLGSVLSALLASVFPYARSARILAFIGLFEYHAFLSSFGFPNHQWDHWLFVTFLLIFLPSLKGRGENQETRRSFSLVFFGAQAFVLLTYTMAGVHKITYGFIQWAGGEASIFSPDAAALHISTLFLNMHETLPLGSLIVEYPFLGTIPFLLVLYLQLFALPVVLKPELHRLWGLGLILFHIGTFLTMRAVFFAPGVLLLILFLSSPFAPRSVSLREALYALPIVSFFRGFGGIKSKAF